MADAASRTYGAANPGFAGTVTGFVNGQDQGSATTGTLSFGTAATKGSNVGTYAVTGSGLTADNGNYAFVQAAGNTAALTVNPATLTYVADAQSRTYGAANPSLTGTVTGFVNNDTRNNATTGTLSFGTTADAGSNVGSYAVTGSGLAAGHGNYVFVQAAGNSAALTINPATLTYVADMASRTYGDANPALTGTVTGFVNNDTQGNATHGAMSFGTTASKNANVGAYAITGSGLTADHGNYVFVQSSGNAAALTINPATLTYVADDQSRTYGAGNPVFTGMVTGFVNNDTQGNATHGTLSFGSAATGASNVGSYDITGSGLTADHGNYVFVQAANNNTALTIDPATLTYVADSQSRTYGDANPSLTGTVTGFVNGQDQGSATTGTLSFGTAANKNSNVGAYAITGAGLTADNGNYVFVQATSNNTALTINPATLTYVADAQSRGYGADNPTLTGTVTGFVNNDTRNNATTGSLSFSTTAGNGADVGSYGITGSGLTADHGNYVFVQAGANSTALTIDPATLTYVADAQSRTYGAANPTFTGTVTGFENGDTQASATTGTLAFSAAAPKSTNVGTYGIIGSGLTADHGDYVFVQAAANSTALTITPATLTYVADTQSRTYGATNPSLTGTVTGFVNNQTQSSATSGTLSFSTGATTASNVGSYAINGAGLTADHGNYVFVQATGNNTALTINPATLTYVADAQSRSYGAANPDLTGTVTGFVNNQTQSSATTGTLSFTTAAGAGANVGAYAITGGGLTADHGNYVFVQAAGNGTALSVGTATLTYIADDQSRTYGAANPTLTGTVTGFENGDTQASATRGTLSFSTNATNSSNVGSYGITGSGLTADHGNYVFVQAAGNDTALTINPAILSYVADLEARTYGAGNPALTGTVTGFVNNDTASSATTGTLGFSTTANTASNVGSYAITGFGLTANSGNYVFAQSAGNAAALTINPATLTYVADAASRTYGAANPDFTGTVTGFVNEDNQANATTGALNFGATANKASNVGSYGITGSGLKADHGNYVFVQAAANGTAMTIDPATLTYVADAQSRTYGAANPTLAGTVTGFVNNDTRSNATTGTLSFSTTATQGSNVGSYGVTGSGLTADHGNYVFVQAAGNSTALTIDPATLTYVADDQSRTYGAGNPVLTGMVTGFENGDTQSSATTGTLSFSTAATSASNVGSYAIIGSGLTANSSNYVFVQAAGNSKALTIDPATLTYVADAASRAYGAANPGFTGTVTGFVNEDNQANATTGTLGFSAAAGAGANVGSYAIRGTGLTADHGNYVFVQAAGNSAALTIDPATLAYVADATSRTYGAANPTLTGTVTGFVNGDTRSNATTGTLSFDTMATQGSNVGSYGVTGSGLTADHGNYVFVQAAGNSTALTIDPATLTYVADDQSRTYGAGNPTLTGMVTGFENGDTQSSATTGTLVFSTAATSASNVGSYAITGSGLTANSSNYVFAQAASNKAALTIDPATLTYVASAASRTYGAANPDFTGTVTGFVNNDTRSTATSGTLSFGSTAGTGADVGRYAITGAGLTADHGNYVFVQAAGNSAALTIDPATLTYVADAQSRTYGAANPVLTGTVTGFVNNDSQSSATTGSLSFGTSAGAGANVGSYAITGSGLSARNYVFVQAAGNAIALNINPATLTYLADAQSRSYGAANPALGGTVTGFENGDTQASATTGTLIFSTAAGAATDVGRYAITGAGLTADHGNYVFVQASGNGTALTIDPVLLQLALTGMVTKTYDGTSSATLTQDNYSALGGVVNGDDVTLASYPTRGSYDSAAAGAGKIVTVSGITLSGAKAGDYTIAGTVSGAIGVIEAPAISSDQTVLVTATVANQNSVNQPTRPGTVYLQIDTGVAAQEAQDNATPPAPIVTAVLTPAVTNPIADLSGGDDGEPSSPAEEATVYLGAAIQNTSATHHGNGGVIIPGLLRSAGRNRGNGGAIPANISVWGNSALWQ